MLTNNSKVEQESSLTGLGFKLKEFIVLTRPKQWTKNLIIFAGLIFSENLFNLHKFLLSLQAFILFCIFSGGIYIINDIVDRNKDKNHPQKCQRPIASGNIKISQAIIFLLIIMSVGLFISFSISIYFALLGLAYFLLNILYSFKLKQIVIIDVMTIASGFVLRAVAGPVIIGERISPWLLICAFLLALFLALNKRKSELMLLSEKASMHRSILQEYNIELINSMLSIVTASTLMSYCLYTFTTKSSIFFMLTIPFVIYGIFRYQYLIDKKGMGLSPELVLLKDKALIIDILLWLITDIYFIYFNL